MSKPQQSDHKMRRPAANSGAGRGSGGSGQQARQQNLKGFALLLSLIVMVAFTAWGFTRLADGWHLFERETQGSGQINSASAGEVTGPVPRTPPLDFSGFRSGNIISDEVMLDWQSMTEQQIADFIAKAGKGCRPGKAADGKEIPCLQHFRTDTGTHVANRFCPGTFTGAKNDSAAAIIYKAAVACQINPQVLLVTLQKEQGLLTAWGPKLTATRYRSAMGYACPDGAECNPKFAGFENQVYYAAQQFQRYRVEPDAPHFAFRAGEEAQIATGVDEQCPRRTVRIENYATAALYNYTPYVPATERSSAYSDGPCATPGNAMFYAYMRAYFQR